MLGHDVLAVAESIPQASDSVILARAASEGRVVVTNDKDFGELAFRSGQAHAGIVLLRLRDESASNRVRVVTNVLERWAHRLPGSFTVATDGTVRIRPTVEQ
jgi:predicted nuclease of predicted toxin-antitoxin system